MTHVNVRADFVSDIENHHKTTYVWFLCNSHGGPGHFVQLGIGERHGGQGPIANGSLAIPDDVMARLHQGFDHWFEWRPVSPAEAFQDRVRQIPIPHPPFIPTLRRVTLEHQSFSLFEAIIDSEEGEQQLGMIEAIAPLPPAPFSERDLDVARRELISPHAPGYLYLVHMENTTLYKIGMSLDPELRLRTLQTGNPYVLRLLHMQAVHDMLSAEVSLHERFAHARVENILVREWFDFGDDLRGVHHAFANFGEEQRHEENGVA